MAKIIPFRGVLYNREKIHDLKDVVTPPYDVISERQRQEYFERHPQNVIRLILSKADPQDTEYNNRYTRAADFFHSWLNEGILVQDTKPAFYVTEMIYRSEGLVRSRLGFIALVRLEDFENRGIDAAEVSLKMHYEIPPHVIAEGQTFKSENINHFKELGRYFANANSVLQTMKIKLPELSEIRCWPHHFDIATLLKIDEDKSAEEARSIGIGFSPGDGAYEEPYFYISPWPYPDLKKSELPELLGGKWHTEGWKGLIISYNSAVKTEQNLPQFIEKTAISAIKKIKSKMLKTK